MCVSDLLCYEQARQQQLEIEILDIDKTGTAAAVTALSKYQTELAAVIRETETQLSVEEAELSAFERALEKLKEDLLKAHERKQIAKQALDAAMANHKEIEVLHMLS